MSHTVISVENLSKAYQLGQINTGTLSRDLEGWWARLRGKPNPFLTIGETDHGNRQGDILWALRDVSFQVEQGEVLGIIGRNGAGKSTLLKILSRVTAPTSGVVKVKGRIASLLEVGTGFHPELTGRENIFLNGAILGMTNYDVKRKMDEIVSFSEVENFLDTPVKRYSSGMYVRLAFAVAAHLDPEILVVDEVLAVGDAEFQKKCLGKMGDASQDGRTVLFVSHNMQAMTRLCKKGVWLDKGEVRQIGEINRVVAEYLRSSVYSFQHRLWSIDEAPGDEVAKLMSVRILNEDQVNDVIDQSQPIVIEMEYINLKDNSNLLAVFTIINEQGVYVIRTHDEFEREWGYKPRPSGSFIARCVIPGKLLAEGRYSVVAEVSTVTPSYHPHFLVRECVGFQIVNQNEKAKWGPAIPGLGIISQELSWCNQYIKVSKQPKLLSKGIDAGNPR